MNDYCQDLIDSDGKRSKIEHHYFRGEKVIDNYLVDGFATVDGKEHYFEFNGCRLVIQTFHRVFHYCLILDFTNVHIVKLKLWLMIESITRNGLIYLIVANYT